MTTHDNDLYAAIAAQVAQYAHVDVGDDVIDKVLMALTIGLRDAVPGAAQLPPVMLGAFA